MGKSSAAVLSLALATLISATPALADRDGHGHGHDRGDRHEHDRDRDRDGGDRHRHEHERRGHDREYRHYADGSDCKYEYKENRGRIKETWKCKSRPVRFRGPPPWVAQQQMVMVPTAPTAAYAAPYGIAQGGCNRDLIGTLIGAAAGGFAGAQIGDGRGQLAATAAGTLLGAVLGRSVGQSMDRVDAACFGQVLEHAPPGRMVSWQNNAGASYQLTPMRDYQLESGRYCREYQTLVLIGGRTQDAYGTACRAPDGSWEAMR